MKLLIGSIFFIVISSIAMAGVQEIYYISPMGSGSICSITQPGSLTSVRDLIRTVNGNMTGDIIIYLRQGTYTLTSTFKLNENDSIHDSGTNGFNIIYKAYPGEVPIVSGGLELSNWTLFDASRNIYHALVPPNFQTRQLYSNSRRLSRARGEYDSAFTFTVAGFLLPPSGVYSNMGNWKNCTDIEVVGKNSWMAYRGPIDSISGGQIVIQQPFWNNSRRQPLGIFYKIEWVENAYELLDSCGEWYLDRSGDVDGTKNPKIYYKPKLGEDINNSLIVAPVLEVLVEGSGTYDRPLHNIRFEGISFQYATWLRPNTNEGYAPDQAGWLWHGYNGNGGIDTLTDDYHLSKTLSHLNFIASKNIVLKNDSFMHMGGAAVHFEDGSQDDSIICNAFEDISSQAIILGHVNNHHPNDPREIIRNITVRNNLIKNIGVEYFDATGIFVAYAENTLIESNAIMNVNYSAISFGWGWGEIDSGGVKGYFTPTPAKNNKIRYNKIIGYMQYLNDGGAIYSLGSQPGSEVSYNHISNQNPLPSDYHGAALYLDEGTKYTYWHDNLMEKNITLASVLNGILNQNNTVINNYSHTIFWGDMEALDTTLHLHNVFQNNITISNSNWPSHVSDIVDSAGLKVNQCGSSAITGIDENSTETQEGNILLYPNPAKRMLFVEVAKDQNIVEIEVFNSIGASVYLQTESVQGNLWSINIENFRSGIYWLAIKMPEKMVVRSVAVISNK